MLRTGSPPKEAADDKYYKGRIVLCILSAIIFSIFSVHESQFLLYPLILCDSILYVSLTLCDASILACPVIQFTFDTNFQLFK